MNWCMSRKSDGGDENFFLAEINFLPVSVTIVKNHTLTTFSSFFSSLFLHILYTIFKMSVCCPWSLFSPAVAFDDDDPFTRTFFCSLFVHLEFCPRSLRSFEFIRDEEKGEQFLGRALSLSVSPPFGNSLPRARLSNGVWRRDSPFDRNRSLVSRAFWLFHTCVNEAINRNELIRLKKSS